MSTFFDDLETQLRDAARNRAHPPHRAPDGRRPARRGRSWLRAGLRGIPVVVAVLTTVAIVVVAVALVRHGGGGPAHTPGGGPPSGLPNLSTPQGRRELGYVQRATDQARRSPGCRAHAFPRPSVIHGTPSGALLSVLGVLRRPATAADRLSADAASGLEAQAYAGAARRALVAHGVSYYIVPVRADPGAGQPPVRCFALQQAALKRELPSIPAALREPTRELQARLIGFDRRVVSQPPYDEVCLVTHARNSGGASCGETAAQITRGIPSLQGDNDTLSGLAPDGVASVTLRFPSRRGRPAVSVSAPVTGNVFVAHSQRLLATARGLTVVWRARDGRVLRTITQPSPGAARAYCRRNAVQCLGIGAGWSEQASSSSSSASATTTTGR